MIQAHTSHIDVNRHADSGVKGIDLLIVFLVFFTSIGWVVDSGTMFTKLIFFILLFISCLYRINKYGASGIKATAILLASPVLIMIYIGFFIHGRTEDLILALKLTLAMLVLTTLPVPTFWKTLPKLLKVLLPFILLGYFFQLFGLYFALPDFILDASKQQYSITPVLTVVRGDEIHRAFGPFWEPGVLAFIANLSLVSKLFILKKQKNQAYWVEFIIIILAQSGGGIISALVIVGASFIKNKINQLLITIVFLIFFTFLLSINFADMRHIVGTIGNLFTLNLLGRDLLTDPSFAARVIDLYAPFLLGVQSFIGHPSMNEFIYFSEDIRGYSSLFITNSFGYLSYLYGFPLMVFYLIVFSWSVLRSSKEVNFILIPVFTILYFSNPLPTVLFSVWLLISTSQSSVIYKVRLYD